MPAGAAFGEAVRNSMNPCTALMYLPGCDRIHALRAEMAALQGARFNLRNFHDQFLSYGSIPVALAAREMIKGEIHAE